MTAYWKRNQEESQEVEEQHVRNGDFNAWLDRLAAAVVPVPRPSESALLS